MALWATAQVKAQAQSGPTQMVGQMPVHFAELTKPEYGRYNGGV